MSIQSEINRITSNIASAYTAAAEKNAQMPVKQNSENLATTILSIQNGVELPELSNPADANEVLSGVEYIDEAGEKKTGTFTIDAELSEQDSLIAQIQTALAGKAAVGDMELPDLTNPGTAADLMSGKELIDGDGNVITGTLPSVEQATPEILVDVDTGEIIARAKQTAGVVPGGTKREYYQLDTQAAQTITPGTADKTIAVGLYLTGTQTIKGDANLLPENIVSGKTIFGVAGTAETGGGGGSGASVETCTVTLKNENSSGDLDFSYMCLSNGQISKQDGYLMSGREREITGCIRNSYFVVSRSDGISSVDPENMLIEYISEDATVLVLSTENADQCSATII